jgi:integrase
MAIMASVSTSTALIPVRAAPLIHVHSVNANPQNITIGELCEQFLYSKSVKRNAGDMVPHVLRRYATMCQRIKAMFGEMTAVENLKAMHFTRLRASLPSTWGPAVVGTFIQNTRTLFKFAYDSELIERPMRFGPDFCKPSLRSYRKAHRLKSLQMFEAEEIRSMLNTLHGVLRRPSRPWGLRAMILLGVNCGFGNADCGRLPYSSLDLKSGWVTFPRPKTEADRRCPLWPETREAIERSLLERPEPRNPADADLVFLTKQGLPWSDGGPSGALTKRLKWLMIRAGVRRLFRGFYGLRRTFRTVADEVSDSPATNLIMGHSQKSNDMGALYTQRISDERLQKVVAHVREWLWPDNPLDWDDPNHEKAAVRIAAEWNTKDRLRYSPIKGWRVHDVGLSSSPAHFAAGVQGCAWQAV